MLRPEQGPSIRVQKCGHEILDFVVDPWMRLLLERWNRHSVASGLPPESVITEGLPEKIKSHLIILEYTEDGDLVIRKTSSSTMVFAKISSISDRISTIEDPVGDYLRSCWNVFGNEILPKYTLGDSVFQNSTLVSLWHRIALPVLLSDGKMGVVGLVLPAEYDYDTLSDLLSASHTALTLWSPRADGDFSCQFANKKAIHTLGSTGRTALIGMGLFEIAPNLRNTDLHHAFLRCVDGAICSIGPEGSNNPEEAFTIPAQRLPAPFDEQRYYRILVSFTSGRISAVFLDVTEEVERERLLAAERHTADTLIAAVQMSGMDIITMNRQSDIWHVASVNERFTRTTGYERDKVIGLSLEAMFRLLRGNEDRVSTERHLSEMMLCLEFGTPVARRVNIITAMGVSRIVELNAIAVFPDNGVPNAVVIFQRDVTEEERSRQIQEQTNRLESQGRMAGGIAHQINNILQPILGFTAQACEDLPDEDKLRKKLEMVLNSARTAKSILADFLAFARGHRDVTHSRDFVKDMHRAIDLASKIVSDQMDIVRTGFLASIDNVGGCKADPYQLMQVVANLVKNATDATVQKVNPVIEIDVSDVWIDSRRHFVLTISDNGIGMDEVTLSRIFDPFFTTKDIGEGTGLGLSMVYGFVQEWKGKIDVSSQLGEGTQISIIIPTV
jgi:PAS domain S-box-containing protein